MKKLLLLLLLLSFTLCFSQSKEEREALLKAKKEEIKEKNKTPASSLNLENGFAFSSIGLNSKFVVNETHSLTQKELFDKSINWIKETYDTPDEVIKTKIENEKIRFKGVSSNAICHYGLGMKFCQNVRYTIELAFKDGRYKFEILEMEHYFEGSEYGRAGWREIYLDTKAEFYYKRGEIIKQLRDYPLHIELLLNGLNLSLFNYLKGNQKVKDDNEW